MWFLISAVVCTVNPVLGQRENGAEAVLPKAEVVLIATPKALPVGE